MSGTFSTYDNLKRRLADIVERLLAWASVPPRAEGRFQAPMRCGREVMVNVETRSVRLQAAIGYLD
jgi:hypothetical protein